MKPTPTLVRFPNLNALRFFAALAVIVFHIEYKKFLYGLPSFWTSSYFISTIGYHAVTFFFVLSGFLITFLLLREKDQSGSIHIPSFYLRRVLRIFPVYYLTIATAFLILPHYFWLFYIPGQTERLFYYFVPAFGLSTIFASNLVFAKFSNLACVDQTWSVSTEEQFYLLWPLVLTITPRKRLVIVFVILVPSC